MSDPTAISGTLERLEKVRIGSALKGFIVWVGGSLAGLTAILYVCGYLITTAHIYTLGLYGLVDFSKDYFLLEGAKFALAIVISVAQIVVGPAAIGVMAILAPLVLLGLFARRPLSRRWQACRDWYSLRASATWPLAMRVGLYCALLIACGVVGYESLLAISFHLQIADLLYSVPDTEQCRLPGEIPIRDAFLCGQSDPLRKAFQRQLWSALTLIAMTCVAWTLVGGWRLRVWLIAPMLFVTVLLTLLLPMEFGALLKPTRYPVVRVHPQDPAALAVRDQFLIVRNEDGLTVWDPPTHRVLWIPSKEIARIETVAVRELFVPPGGSP